MFKSVQERIYSTLYLEYHRTDRRCISSFWNPRTWSDLSNCIGHRSAGKCLSYKKILMMPSGGKAFPIRDRKGCKNIGGQSQNLTLVKQLFLQLQSHPGANMANLFRFENHIDPRECRIYVGCGLERTSTCDNVFVERGSNQRLFSIIITQICKLYLRLHCDALYRCSTTASV